MKVRTSVLVSLCLLVISFIAAADQVSAAEDKADRTERKALSLRILQERLRACEQDGACPEAITQLGGLTRITGYVTDDAGGDVILVGEADAAAPPLHLEDLVVAFRNARLDYAELRGNTYYYSNPGCSIDPDEEVMARLGDVAAEIFSVTSESEIERGIENWYRICHSPQAVSVFGIPFDTRFAKVMVDADYDMKKLVDGSDSLSIPGFTGLTDMTLALAKRDMLAGNAVSISATSMNRFWFHPGDVTYRDDEGVKVIEECSVVLLTEEEYLTSGGNVVGSGRANVQAGEFARCFSNHYDEIAEQRPIYRELENLFVIVALAKLLETDGVLGGTPLDLGYLLDIYRVPTILVNSMLAGRANVKGFSIRNDYPGGYSIAKMWIPSCGGVGIDIEVTKRSVRRDRTGELMRLRATVLHSRPSPSTLSWAFMSA